MTGRYDVPRSQLHRAMSTPLEIAAGPAPFPKPTAEAPCETAFVDWRRRLARNLSRRSDGRWDPLTRIHPPGR